MRCSKALYRLAAAVTCVAVWFSCGGGALAYDDYFWSSATIGSTDSPGSVLVSKYQLYNGDGSSVNDKTDEADFDTSIGALLTNCNTGEAQASKDGFYASEEDAKNGIVKLVIDVVTKFPPRAIDVMFVLDESGSMTMNSSSAGHYVYTVPCLNKDHFYKINYQYRIESTDSPVLTFDLWPNEIADDNCWNAQNFQDAIKAKIKETNHKDENITHLTLVGWNTYDFGNHHYKKDGETDVRIEKKGQFDTTLGINSGRYYSPPEDNEDGCIDRQMIAKEAIRDMATEVLQNNGSNSYIGYVGFAGILSASRKMDHSLPGAELNRLNGYDSTNYQIGLEGEVGVNGVHGVHGAKGALQLLQQRLDGADGITQRPTDQKTIVVFITDGMPNAAITGSGTPQDGAVAAAEKIKAMDNTTLYCVGIKSGAAHLLEQMATSQDCFKECNTRDEFETFLRNLTATISKPTIVEDVIGDGYELICDQTHPITVKHGTDAGGETAYTTLDAAADAGITLDQDNKLQWQVKDADREGNRLSFYVKLNDTNYKSALQQYEGAFPTNKSATVSYHKVTDAAPAGEQNATIFPLDNPATIKVEQSRLTATKASDRPDQVVLPHEELTYTITLQNTGVLDLSNVKVADELPAETAYVPNSGGTLEGNKVTFSSSSLAANGEVPFSFSVRVLEGQSRITNYAMFGTDSVQTSLNADGSPACYANLVTNPRPHHVASSSPPQTGDNATPLLWAALAAVSMLACTVLFKRRKHSV